jgi:hypothetical protein
MRKLGGRWRKRLELDLGVDVPCAVPARNDTVVGAYFGRASQGPEMEPPRVTERR